MTVAIETDSLVRRFNGNTAVDALTFSLAAGEIVGCVGPNGAGKTTTIRLLNGVLTPTSGHARVLGRDPTVDGQWIRRRTGILTEGITLYERLTALENLRFHAALHGVPRERVGERVATLLGMFDLESRARDRVGTFSTGLKQRLAIARAIVHEPDVLYLDEPTASLDPEAARHVTDMLERLRSVEGRTIFLATHNLAEAERLCTRVMIMKAGRLVAFGTRDELLGARGREVELDIGLLGRPDARVRELIGSWSGGGEPSGIERAGDGRTVIRVRVDGENAIPRLIRSLAEAGAPIISVVPHRRTLEDLYFEIQGVDIEDGGFSS